MRNSTGQTLREARLRKGLDLYEVHRVTKLSVESLRAMEEDRWEELPPARAEEQLRAYAGFLGLGEDFALEEPARREPRGGGRMGTVLLAIGFAAVVGLIIGVVALAPLGGSGGGGGGGGGVERTTTGVATQSTTTAPTTPVSVQIRTHALVWVCLVDQRGRPVINGVNLVRDQTVGPYDGKSFEVAFGNGKVDLTVNGAPVEVPNIAEPFGFRITPGGADRLDPSEEPTCT